MVTEYYNGSLHVGDVVFATNGMHTGVFKIMKKINDKMYRYVSAKESVIVPVIDNLPIVTFTGADWRFPNSIWYIEKLIRKAKTDWRVKFK